MAYDNQNKVAHGSLSKGTKKSDRSPGYIGSITIDAPVAVGEKLWLAAWVKEGDGKPYFSIVAERPREQQRSVPQSSAPQRQSYSAAPPRRNEAGDMMDDEIPF